MSTLKVGDRIIQVDDSVLYKTTIHDLLLENSIYINNPCNGKGTCGKCKIKILRGNVSEIDKTELKHLSEVEINNGIRLACSTKMCTDIEIDILDKEKKLGVLVDSFTRDFEKNNLMDAYGLAIDIGTTTVVVELVDLRNGNVVCHSSNVNPQKKYGLDVLTRITYENENLENGIEDLKQAIVYGINDLISKIVYKSNIEINDIKKIVVSANCTMTHMFLGIDAKSIGTYPYKPVFTEAQIFNSKELGLNVADDCILICLPHVSSFIGSDIVSGIYTCDLKNIKGNVLFIDIGTNAEIVLKTDNMLVSCSCAAGPALEGMNISKGMRAEIGAIEDVKIEGDNVFVKTIGNINPEGLCGSGILAVIRELIKNSILKKSGSLINPDNLDKNDSRKNRIVIINNKKEYIICKNENINITQGDIRQVQLSKAAILSGFISLLNECNIDMSQLDKILVAGQFGAHLSVDSIVGVGILPSIVKDKIEYVGNVSKTGAYITLMSKKALEEMKSLSKEVKYIELADTKDYENTFVKSMEFPSI